MTTHELFREHGINVSKVLDLGANRGNFSVVAAQYASDVVSIEPHRLAFKVLKKNRTNNMRLINAAAVIGHSPESLNLMTVSQGNNWRTLYKSESSSSIPGKKDLNINSYEQVKTCDIRSLIEENFFDIIKMDVEGAELQLLPYLKENSSRFGKLFCELHTSKFLQSGEFLLLSKDLPSNIYLDWI